MSTEPSCSSSEWAQELIVDMLEQFKNKSDPVIIQLLGCGEDSYNLLVSVAESLSSVGGSTKASCESLEALVALSYDKLKTTSSTGDSELCWRRMYTDTSILRSLIEIDTNTALDAIGFLDRAIVIAGAAGEGRLDLILSLISNIQTRYVPRRHLSLDVSRPLHTRPDVSPIQSSKHPIPASNCPPSFETFQTTSYKKPFILRGFAGNWPAINERPWSSAAYLRSVAGPGRLVPVEVGEDYRADDWTQRLMNWDEFVTSLALGGQETLPNKGEVLYLAQHNLLMQFPRLNADIMVPDYAYASLPPPPDHLSYEPPRNAERLVINGWLGPKGTISPAHTDPYYNLFVQVVGRKTIWITSPTLSKGMYPYSAQHSENPAANINDPSLSNTSRVDVFGRRDDVRYPEFWEHVVADELTMHATLEPGDLLFLPPGWWHAMKAEDVSFSVSMWF